MAVFDGGLAATRPTEAALAMQRQPYLAWLNADGTCYKQHLGAWHEPSTLHRNPACPGNGRVVPTSRPPLPGARGGEGGNQNLTRSTARNLSKGERQEVIHKKKCPVSGVPGEEGEMWLIIGTHMNGSQLWKVPAHPRVPIEDSDCITTRKVITKYN